jgi:hypothetical protein
MAVALVPLAWMTLGLPPMPFSPLFRVLSGQLFGDRVVPFEQNVFDALTPFVVRDFFSYFAVIAVTTLLYLAGARAISDRTTDGGRSAFALPAAAACACLLVLLTIPFVWLVQYTRSMGMTLARFSGLACAIVAFALIGAFCWWCVRRPKQVGPEAGRAVACSRARGGAGVG